MHDVKERGLERKGFVFDEQYPLSSLCYYPLTVLGDFCSPDFGLGYPAFSVLRVVVVVIGFAVVCRSRRGGSGLLHLKGFNRPGRGRVVANFNGSEEPLPDVKLGLFLLFGFVISAENTIAVATWRWRGPRPWGQ